MGGSLNVLAAAGAAMAAMWIGAAPALGQATGTVSGRVLHSVTREPVPGAVVVLRVGARGVLATVAGADENDVRVVTGTDGGFSVSGLAAGEHHVLVEAEGFLARRFDVVIGAQPQQLDVPLDVEIHFTEVISVSPTPKNQFDTYQATSVLAGQDLAVNLQSTLGASLSSQPGMAERSFGPAPSRPVIRGFDGDRVLILENGQRMGDLSSQSGDHGVVTNPAATPRIEVVRGPAALLYGSGALGGLVNLVNDSVPSAPISGLRGALQFDAGTAASEGGAAADLTWGNGRVALHAGGSGRKTGDVDTPEGTVENTQLRSGFGDVGVSWTSQKGHLGASYGYDDTRYGVPVIEEGQVELTPRRHTVNVRGERRELGGILESVRGLFGYRRYRHDEVVAGEPETRFANDTTELDIRAGHRPAGRLSGTVGAWTMWRAFESTGAEALSPPVDQGGVALFAYEEVTWPHATLQFGARFDRASYDPDADDPVLYPERDFSDVSGSVGLLVRPTSATTLAFSAARAVRHPALEELYYFGPHPGNFAFEIGNAGLDSEVGLGFDVAFRWRVPRVSGEVSFFRNDIRDFIFRNPISEEEFEEKYGWREHGHDEGHHEESEFPYVEYISADSVLQGLEMHTDVQVVGGLTLDVGMDYVRGTLEATDEPLPRIPPFRVMTGLRYQRGGLQLGGEVTAVADQDRVHGEETPTDGYGLLKLYGAYSFAAGGALHTVTLRLDNATNELYRNHLSYIKDYVAETGRNFKVVYRVDF